MYRNPDESIRRLERLYSQEPTQSNYSKLQRARVHAGLQHFPHNCDACIFLESNALHARDYYYCPMSDPDMGGSLLIRYGAEDAQYASYSVVWALRLVNPEHPYVTHAVELAIKQGLVEQPAWWRSNPDEDIRRLERQAASDPDAAEKLRIERIRRGATPCDVCGEVVGTRKCPDVFDTCETFVCPNCECGDGLCDYVRSVERNLHGVEHFSTGAAPGCEACDLGNLDVATMTESDYYTVDEAEEGGFSWSACESCNSSLGGDRYPAHGFINDELIHFEICNNCLFFHAMGDLPDPRYL